jgi:Sulfotransferase family
MKTVAPKTRIFLVGCPRSGTTLLQSLLAAHSQVCSFPESHFFSTLVPNRWLIRKLDLYARNIKPRLERFLSSLDLSSAAQSELMAEFPAKALFNRQYAYYFINLLDQIADGQQKPVWIEKTPGHLHYIDYIEQLQINAKFIHILRNGTDVIASFYELAQRYPEIWGSGWNLERCVERWLQDTETSSRYVQQPNHHLVRYEQLVETPEAVLKQLTQFIDIEFEPQMLQTYDVAAQKVSLDNEPWKKPVAGKIKTTNSQKFYQVFDAVQQQYVSERLAVVDLEKLFQCI